MLGRNCSRPASSPARSQSCQNRTNPPTKFGSWPSFAPAKQCSSGLSLSTCALGQTQRKRKRNACNTGSRKLGFCLEIRACQPPRLGYSKSFGPHRQETGKQFSEKLLSVCIPLIFFLHLRTPQIPSNRLSACTGQRFLAWILIATAPRSDKPCTVGLENTLIPP